MRRKYEFYKNERLNSIAEIIVRSGRLYGDSTAVRFKKRMAAHEKSYNDLLRDSRNFARHLLSDGEIRHAAILGPSGYEWIVAYLGLALAGLVVIPLDKELPAEELTLLLGRADADALIYDAEYADVAGDVLRQTGLRGICMDDMDKLPFRDLTFPETDPHKLFEIVFTSGTTGKSKGVMLSQGNIAGNVWQGLGAVDVRHGRDVIMSVLPFSHTYEFTCTVLGMIFKGVPICIGSGLKYFQRELKEYSPTLMFIVPLIAERLYQKVEFEVAQRNKTKLFRLLSRFNTCLYPLGLDVSRLFFRDIKAGFGGRLLSLLCGGAQLSEELIQKYRGLGLNLFQGYGLTECSPLLAVNFDYYHRPNSVGKTVAQCEIKQVDGELWARGISVSQGYYKDAAATAEAFKDGWFRTGDLGYVDKDGFVFLTGRRKNLIILQNGENISAEELEALIEKLGFVSEALVYGENGLIAAELYMGSEKTVSPQTVRTAIDRLNTKLPAYKRIDKVKFRDTPFEKTTSGKIRRIYG